MKSVGQLLVVLCIALLCTSAAQAIVYDNPRFGGCVIATDNGALQDGDCDRTPDPYDNCPLTTNPDQVDSDRNGIGDACDLIIEEIRIEPDMPMQGRSMVVTVALLNNRAYPMRNMVVKAEAPKLGVADNQDVALIAPGERVRKELIMRVPDCAQARPTDVAVMAEYPFAPGQKEVFSEALRVPVVPSGQCAQEVGSDKTIVEIIELQDIDPINGAIYPFTIKNTQAESRAYVLSVEGLEQWGAAEIHPGTVVIVPAGEAREGAIQVWARPEVTGKRSFTFSVQAKDDAKQVVLLANVPQPAQMIGPSPMIMVWGIIAFLIILGLIVGIVMFVRQRK